MRKVWIVRLLMVSLLMLTISACEAEEHQEPTIPAAEVTDTAVPATPTTEPATEEPTETPTATPQPTETPRPTASPIPTPRPLAEGECIAWYEAPSFLDREVCVEGRVNFVRSANPARTLFFVVLDPSVPDIDHCCGLFYGWLYANKLYESPPEGGMSELLEDKCVRIQGAVEKGEGQEYRISIKTKEQFEIIECSECQHPDACSS